MAFRRQPPPLLLRCFMGVIIDGVARPLVRILDKFGRAGRLFAGMRKRQIKQLAAKNPFKGYVPSKHDVFAAVYIKSGTNWPERTPLLARPSMPRMAKSSQNW